VYISRDIVFNESVLPFASLHSNTGAQLRADILLLPSSLQPLSMHNHEERDLQIDHDANPADPTLAESFLQSSGENSGPGDFYADFSSPDTGPGDDSPAQSSRPASPGQSASGSVRECSPSASLPGPGPLLAPVARADSPSPSPAGSRGLPVSANRAASS
jgi:hypothetical protein